MASSLSQFLSGLTVPLTTINKEFLTVLFSQECTEDRVHTEWQWPLSGVHPIMMVKSAQPGGGGGCTPTPFHSIYHHVQSCGVRSN
jgi:hypothetical protein